MPISTIAKRRSRPSVALLDANFTIRLGPPDGLALDEALLSETARRIASERIDHADVAVDGVTYRVRVTELHGPEPMRYAIFVERRGSRRPLLDAYDRFGLSAREIEVLSLIVDGASNREIASTLCIEPGTVQDHVHSLCAKSGAKRRGDLLARVFGVDETQQ